MILILGMKSFNGLSIPKKKCKIRLIKLLGYSYYRYEFSRIVLVFL